MKLLKLILVTSVLLFSLFILGSWFYAGRVVAYYKPNIEKVLSDKTGYTITFDSASVKFYPYIGIKLAGLSADSSAGCAPWHVEQTSIKIALRPLLNRRIDILRIDFSGIEGALRLAGEGVVTANREGKICGLHAVANQSKNADSMPSKAPVENTTQSVHEDFPINLSLDKVTIEQVKLSIFREKQKHLFLIDQAQAAVQLNDQGVFLPQLFMNGAFDADKIALEVKDLQSNADNSAFKLAAARVQVDQQKLIFSGEYDRRTANGNFSLDLSSISLQQLSKIAADSIPKSQGVVNGQFKALLAGDDITVTGAASLAEAQTIAKNFSATKLALSEVSLELKKFALHSLKTEIDLENFKAEYEGDSYEVGHLQGPLLVTSAADIQFSGGLQIENFGYADNQTSIKKVLAKLNNIKGQVSAKGDVVIDLDLEARGMQLNDPAIEIKSVESVSAPLRVRIPAGSGYSVAGPVAIHNGVTTLSERELKKVSATVAISLSGALMDFRSTNLSAESGGQALKGTTHCAITNDKYQISDTVFNLGDGALSVKLSLGRKDLKPVSLNVTVKDLPMESAYRAIMQKDESPLRGKATSLALQLTGNKKDLPASLAGSGSVQIDDFIFQTINIEQLFKNALASIPLVGPDLVPSDDVQLDKDGDLTASISIAESVVSVPDLKIQLSNLTIESSLQLGFDSIVKGSASVVLLEQTFGLLGFGFERLGSFLAREGRIAIPLLITGAITSPSVSPDIEAIAKFATGIDLIESVVSGVEEVADEL